MSPVNAALAVPQKSLHGIRGRQSASFMVETAMLFVAVV
jgi:hypothetical protein